MKPLPINQSGRIDLAETLANTPGQEADTASAGDARGNDTFVSQKTAPASKPGVWTVIADTLSRIGLIILLCAAAFVISGFVRFSGHVSKLEGGSQATIAGKADGIVVLTGGKDRINEALKLFETGKAKRLLISGVHPKTSHKAILHVAKADGAAFDCCVDLDHLALDTIGNAEQTAAWAQANGFKSLIVVTSSYHMPRSLLEMRSRMPEIEIQPYIVSYSPLGTDNWIKNPETLKVVMSEYMKYLAASFRVRTR